MGELDFFDSSVDSESFGEHSKRPIRNVVVAHVQNLEVALLEHTFSQGFNLGVRKLISHKVELADWHDNEQARQNLARYFVVVNVKLGYFPALNRLNKSHGSVIVDVIVLEIDFLNRWTSVDQIADHEAPLRAHIVL